MLQNAVKLLLDQRGSSSEQADQLQILLKTCFLYFFRLIGIKEDDKASLDILFEFLNAPKRRATAAAAKLQLTKA